MPYKTVAWTDLRPWLESEGFIQESSDNSLSGDGLRLGKAWSHSSGYGWITLEFDGRGSWVEAILSHGSAHGRIYFGLGAVVSLDDAKELYAVLSRRDYDNVYYREQQ